VPKTVKNLWSHVATFQNLHAAWLEARKGKRYTGPCMQFGWGLEGRLLELESRLNAGTWRPSPPYEFGIVDPKPRRIQAPPFADRVVHHALVRQIEPCFERRFIADSYACRAGKGSHAAVERLQGFLRHGQGRWGDPWVLKADVRRYFPSIQHARLMRAIGREIGDRRVVALAERIIRGYGHEDGVGLPIGALTSQLFANVYLDQLDHYVKDQLGVKLYVRYMDDFVIVGPSKAALWEVHDAIADYLEQDLGLQLNHKTDVFPARHGVDFCGYRTWTTHRLPRKRTVKRARRRFRRLARLYREGEVDLEDIRPQVTSFIGYMQRCDGRRTLEGVLGDLVLTRSSS